MPEMRRVSPFWFRGSLLGDRLNGMGPVLRTMAGCASDDDRRLTTLACL